MIKKVSLKAKVTLTAIILFIASFATMTFTKEKAVDIVNMSKNAVVRTGEQSDLTKSNYEMTQEIATGMESIAQNISNISTASVETAREAQLGAE